MRTGTLKSVQVQLRVSRSSTCTTLPWLRVQRGSVSSDDRPDRCHRVFLVSQFGTHGTAPIHLRASVWIIARVRPCRTATFTTGHFTPTTAVLKGATTGAPFDVVSVPGELGHWSRWLARLSGRRGIVYEARSVPQDHDSGAAGSDYAAVHSGANEGAT